MKTNQLENEFKEKLNAREIKPSEMAWDRLDAMLTVAEQPKRKYNWLYIAASFLGFMLVATVFLSQTEIATDKAKTNVVFENKKLPINQVPKETQKIVVSNNDEVLKADENSVSTKSEGFKKAINSKQITKQKAVIVANTNQKTNKINEKNQNQLVNNTIINQKIEQTPIINNIESSGSIVAENAKNAKVDELLANATAFKTVNSKIKINPNDLLSQVDGELELTFREKVIQTVNRNFKSAKVALSNRNK